MPKRNYGQAKRQREASREQKKAEKQLRKAERQESVPPENDSADDSAPDQPPSA